MIFLVMNKGISDQGHFIQSLTSLIINSPSITLSKESIDFYRQAFDDQDTEVMNFFVLSSPFSSFLFRLIFVFSNV